MRKTLAFILLAVMALGSRADVLSDMGERLLATECYADSVRYELLLASLAEPVTYTINLRSTTAPDDSLAAADYIIDWSLPAPSGISSGFSSYFDGTHYRMRDSRLQEYHNEWNPEVFAPSGDVLRGVQNQAQFIELLPQTIGRRFLEMSADSTYIYKVENTTFDGTPATIVRGVRRAAGFDGAEYVYILDSETLLPRRLEFENNPGQIGEQSIVVTYSGVKELSPCAINQATLEAEKAEAFENFRESTFSLETLPGKPLPRITARTSTGERYSHDRGETFTAPTVIAFLDAQVGSTPGVIVAVRNAVDMLPQQTDVVWAFLNHRADDVEAAVPQIRPGEHLLVAARGAARDCGVGAVTPVLIFASRDGRVTDFIIGDNQDLTSLVLQKAGLAGRK